MFIEDINSEASCFVNVCVFYCENAFVIKCKSSWNLMYIFTFIYDYTDSHTYVFKSLLE